MNKETIKMRMALPLELKIKLSINRIEQFYQQYGDCYVSRGGLDSLVVSKLVNMSCYKDKIKNVCVASCEPVENIIFNKEDCILLKSEHTLKDVITKYGYPLISKDVAMKLSRYERTKSLEQKHKRLKGYIGNNGKLITAGMIPIKYQDLIYAPFSFSEKCCDLTKKKPLKIYEKENYTNPITGERVEESWLRKQEYMRYGCIHTGKRIKCTPIAFWTEQDKLKFLKGSNIPTIYGTINRDSKGELYLTGEKRTGCEVCGFGIFANIERLYSLANRKPKLFNYMMRGGQWEYRDTYRLVKFSKNSDKIKSNRYWIPNDYGLGYAYPINYIFDCLNINYKIVNENQNYKIIKIK